MGARELGVSQAGRSRPLLRQAAEAGIGSVRALETGLGIDCPLATLTHPEDLLPWAAGEIVRLRDTGALADLDDCRVQMSCAVAAQLNMAVSSSWMRTFAAEGFDLWISLFGA